MHLLRWIQHSGFWQSRCLLPWWDKVPRLKVLRKREG